MTRMNADRGVRLALDGFAGELACGFVGVPQREHAGLDLLFRVVTALVALGQPGHRQRQRKQVDELAVAALLFVRVHGGCSRFGWSV